MSSPSVRAVRAFVGAVVVAAAWMAAAPVPAPAAIVARPLGPTDLREYGGTIVFSELDVSQWRYRLVVRKVGADPQRVNVPMSTTRFGADIGTDSRGRPQLIYERCRMRRGCELFVYSLADATGERPVRTAGVLPSFSLVTLWRGRIAWTQDRGGETAVYTKLLTAPRSQPPTRLPGVPTVGGTIRGLELWGTNLAMIAGDEVRLDDISDRSARKVAQFSVGSSGERLAGPSFFDGRLAWYRGCLAAAPGCRSEAGAWRYRLSTRTYEQGSPGPLQVEEFADAGTRHYVFLCSSETEGTELHTGCRIEENTPPAYSSARP